MSVRPRLADPPQKKIIIVLFYSNYRFPPFIKVALPPALAAALARAEPDDEARVALARAEAARRALRFEAPASSGGVASEEVEGGDGNGGGDEDEGVDEDEDEEDESGSEGAASGAFNHLTALRHHASAAVACARRSG